MNTINWGIIGCGDVTELKSGPAFNKVPNSSLVAVMRRNAEKAADYAKRHHVPIWYNNADELINDQHVNAIYIATPPVFHEAYTLAAIKAGKHVYVEKPMTINFKAAQKMYLAAEENNVKLTVAHYRREWPMFKKIKELIETNVIGSIHLVRLQYDKPALTASDLADEKTAWRVNPELSGGGLFHDLAPHQLDILYLLFGEAKRIQGIATNQSGNYKAHDLVAGTMLFKNNIAFSGSWYFNALSPIDYCEIAGSKGRIRFSFFNCTDIEVTVDDNTTTYYFNTLQHVQQPMIEKTINYFLGNANNPCTGYEGAVIMRWMDILVSGR